MLLSLLLLLLLLLLVVVVVVIAVAAIVIVVVYFIPYKFQNVFNETLFITSLLLHITLGKLHTY
jgi:hypothetical protein